LRVLYATLFIVIADQITKFLVKGGTIPLLNIQVTGMDYGSSIPVIGDFFKITFVENPGIAFGIDIDGQLKFFLTLFTLLASIGIFYYLYKSRHEKFFVRLALALILGGAIGNMIDRMFYGMFYGYEKFFYGYVVDFFNVDFFDFTIFGRTYERWPIFNVADASVSIGVVLLLIFHNGSEVEERKSVDEKEISADGEILTESESVVDSEDKGEMVSPISTEQLDNPNDGEISNREKN
jgi:signal peptidase II